MNSPSMFSSRYKTASIVLGIPGIVALTIWGALSLANRLDNPQNSHRSAKQTIKYLGVPAELTLSCDCPPYLIESKPYSLNFDVRIKRSAIPPSAIPKEELWLYAQSTSIGLDTTAASVGTSEGFVSDEELIQTIALNLKPNGTSSSQISFTLDRAPLGGGSVISTIGSINWPISSQPPFLVTLRPLAYAGLAFLIVAGVAYWIDRKFREIRKRDELRSANARKQAQDNPEKASFAWEAANVNLQAYFDRNLLQVKMVFWVSVLVMIVGFGFVLAGVMLSLGDPRNVTPTSKVAAYSGIVTQFIGATFMVIYRSTMAQANEFMSVLDRINTVGMAVKVLDSIPDSQVDLKNKTRAQIVQLLLTANHRVQSTRPFSSAKQKNRRSLKSPSNAVSDIISD